jgi:hypothetical protein
VTSHVTSADGTRIAFDHLGDGPPVVVVDMLPAGRLTLLEGQDHGAPAGVVAPVVAAFLDDAGNGRS